MGDNPDDDDEDQARPGRRARHLRPFRTTAGNPMLVLSDDGPGDSAGPVIEPPDDVAGRPN